MLDISLCSCEECVKNMLCLRYTLHLERLKRPEARAWYFVNPTPTKDGCEHFIPLKPFNNEEENSCG